MPPILSHFFWDLLLKDLFDWMNTGKYLSSKSGPVALIFIEQHLSLTFLSLSKVRIYLPGHPFHHTKWYHFFNILSLGWSLLWALLCMDRYTIREGRLFQNGIIADNFSNEYPSIYRKLGKNYASQSSQKTTLALINIKLSNK